jgi:hypothetical protein
MDLRRIGQGPLNALLSVRSFFHGLLRTPFDGLIIG